MFTKDELAILSSSVTHFTEAGWCPPERVPRQPTPMQAAYLLEALEQAAPEKPTAAQYTLTERLQRHQRSGRVVYSEKQVVAITDTVSRLKIKLHQVIA